MKKTKLKPWTDTQLLNAAARYLVTVESLKSSRPGAERIRVTMQNQVAKDSTEQWTGEGRGKDMKAAFRKALAHAMDPDNRDRQGVK